MKWNPRPGARNIRLAYEVEEGSGRPGPRELWAKFDRGVKQLGIALEGESIRAIADAFSQLSADTREIANAIAVPADEQDAARRNARADVPIPRLSRPFAGQAGAARGVSVITGVPWTRHFVRMVTGGGVQRRSGMTSGTRVAGPGFGCESSRNRWRSFAPRAWSGPKCSIQRISQSSPITHAPGSPGRHHQRGSTPAGASARQIPTRIGPEYPGSARATCVATYAGIGSSSTSVVRPGPDREHARLADRKERDTMARDQRVALDQPPAGWQRGERLRHTRFG